MLGYSAQIPPRDRWAIIAYVRALQLSRNAKLRNCRPACATKLESSGSSAGNSEGKE